MDVAIIDACALINLVHTASFEAVATLPLDIRCQGLVEDELEDQSSELAHLFETGRVTKLIGDIPASEVAEIMAQHRLGVGEAECIAFCQRNDWLIISDDQRARKVATKAFGTGRVTGTIGILCNCVDSGKMSNDAAFEALSRAREAGGYLPDYDFGNRRIRAKLA